MPKISIIVPCYNQAQYLDEALLSVLNQTYSNWECIIVNDGSPDNTAEVAKKQVEKDQRFKYLYQENKGLSSARNYGLNYATGDWILFLDSDDILDYRKIEMSLNEINLNKKLDKLIIISNFILFLNDPSNLISESKFKISQLNFETILYKWDDYFTIPIHCGFFEASLFENFRFPENIFAKEDWVMWVYLFKNKCKVVHLDQSLALYRKHRNSMTMKIDLLPEYVKAYEYVKSIISEEEGNKLSVSLFSLYFRKSADFNKKLNDVKKSNTYRYGNFIKKIFKKLKILKPAKLLFNKILKSKVCYKYLNM